jgi:hypothetical protein
MNVNALIAALVAYRDSNKENGSKTVFIPDLDSGDVTEVGGFTFNATKVELYPIEELEEELDDDDDDDYAG